LTTASRRSFSGPAWAPAWHAIGLLGAAIAALLLDAPSVTTAVAQSRAGSAIAFTNGRWFNGATFDLKAVVYSVDGRFSFVTPAGVDETIDLGGAWVIPPLADAHNHNVSNGAGDDADRRAIARFLTDGIFYVKVPGNVPLSEDGRRRLRVNTADGLDVSFGHGSITGSRGHPIPLVSSLAAAGVFAGHTPDSLRDLRYFVADSQAELNAKWPQILSHRPDFIKTILVFSEDHERYEKDPLAVPPLDGRTARKGVNPRLLPAVVERAHASRLRVSAHVTTATDFRNAVAAGVDEINHLPPRRTATVAEDTSLTAEDARETVRRGIVIVTTLALPANVPDTPRAVLRQRQQTSLRLMHDAGVRLAIGTDNPDDTSVQEAMYVRELGVLDNLTVLKMWVEVTPATVFPTRQIGYVREGFEASFLALSGNPVSDLQNVQRIALRVKQGRILIP
jgi:imidazolonepropionase-like amidohydrolase